MAVWVVMSAGAQGKLANDFAGLGGITWHLGQFHIGSLFPRARGVVSGCAVGGFVGSGIIFLMLKVVHTLSMPCRFVWTDRYSFD